MILPILRSVSWSLNRKQATLKQAIVGGLQSAASACTDVSTSDKGWSPSVKSAVKAAKAGNQKVSPAAAADDDIKNMLGLDSKNGPVESRLY